MFAKLSIHTLAVLLLGSVTAEKNQSYLRDNARSRSRAKARMESDTTNEMDSDIQEWWSDILEWWSDKKDGGLTYEFHTQSGYTHWCTQIESLLNKTYEAKEAINKFLASGTDDIDQYWDTDTNEVQSSFLKKDNFKKAVAETEGKSTINELMQPCELRQFAEKISDNNSEEENLAEAYEVLSKLNDCMLFDDWEAKITDESWKKLYRRLMILIAVRLVSKGITSTEQLEQFEQSYAVRGYIFSSTIQFTNSFRWTDTDEGDRKQKAFWKLAVMIAKYLQR
jgi:hypothetical protein